MRNLQQDPALWRWDIPLAAAAAVLSIAVTAVEFHNGEVTGLPQPVAYLAAVVSSAVLVWRRCGPVIVVGITGVLAVAFLAAGSHSCATALVIALYSVAKYGHRWIAVFAGAAVIMSATVAVGLLQSWSTALGVGLWLIVWLEAGIIAGEIVGRQQRKLQSATERAQAAERSRDELISRTAGEERLRIARELHDSLTHAISVVNVQSSVALHVLPRQPQQAEAALRNIRDASQTAMRELRATLQALRLVDANEAPGIAALPHLVAVAEQAGATVELTIEGTDRRLPETVERTIYRIVQEALTNAARHSDADRVAVVVRYSGDRVSVTVSDNGSDGGAFQEGLGLLGMRERVTALGGRLRFGRAAAGGFEVRAVLDAQTDQVEEAV